MNRRRKRARTAPSIIALLLALSMLPLSGAAWFSAGEVGEAHEAQTVAEDVARDTERFLVITETEAALLDESYWSVSRKRVSDLGLSVDTVRSASGFDLDLELAAAQDAVDALVIQIDDPGFVGAVEDARSIEEADESTYGPAQVWLAETGAAIYQELSRAAGDATETAELLSTLRVFEDAANARRAFSVLQWSYFSSQFAITGVDTSSFLSLVDARSTHRQALRRIESRAAPGSLVAATVAALSDSADLSTFDAAVDELVDGVVEREGEAVQGPGFDDDFRIEEVLDAYNAGRRTNVEHIVLVRSAGDDVVAASTTRSRAAQAQRQQLLLIGFGVAIASLAIALMIARYIARPLHSLATGAEQVGRGDNDVRLDLRGPREVQLALSAFNAAGENLQLVDRLQHEANHDHLTQAASRRASTAALEQAIADAEEVGVPGACMFVDLDDFKGINDRHGHAAGDVVLREVSRRLQVVVGSAGQVGRFGGDEFVVIARSLSDDVGASRLARRLLDEVARPIAVEGLSGEVAELTVTVSIGVAIFGAGRRTVQEILEAADQAAYQSKRQGRNRVTIEQELGRTAVAIGG